MNITLSIVICAVLVENVWSTIEIIVNAIIQRDKININKSIGSLLIGLLIAFNYNLNIALFVGLDDQYQYVGVFLTGILISRGSSFIHDLLKTIENIRANTK